MKREETSYKNLSSDERESKKVLDSGLHTVDTGFKVLDSGFFVTGTWIPDSRAEFRISVFKVQDSGLRKQKILDSEFLK